MVELGTFGCQTMLFWPYSCGFGRLRVTPSAAFQLKDRRLPPANFPKKDPPLLCHVGPLRLAALRWCAQLDACLTVHSAVQQYLYYSVYMFSWRPSESCLPRKSCCSFQFVGHMTRVFSGCDGRDSPPRFLHCGRAHI